MENSRRINNGSVLLLTGHGLRFKTKADKRKAEEERKENENKDSSVIEMKRSSSSPQPLTDPHAELQQAVWTPLGLSLQAQSTYTVTDVITIHAWWCQMLYFTCNEQKTTIVSKCDQWWAHKMFVCRSVQSSSVRTRGVCSCINRMRLSVIYRWKWAANQNYLTFLMIPFLLFLEGENWF